MPVPLRTQPRQQLLIQRFKQRRNRLQASGEGAGRELDTQVRQLRNPTKARAAVQEFVQQRLHPYRDAVTCRARSVAAAPVPPQSQAALRTHSWVDSARRRITRRYALTSISSTSLSSVPGNTPSAFPHFGQHGESIATNSSWIGKPRARCRPWPAAPRCCPRLRRRATLCGCWLSITQCRSLLRPNSRCSRSRIRPRAYSSFPLQGVLALCGTFNLAIAALAVLDFQLREAFYGTLMQPLPMSPLPHQPDMLLAATE